MKPLSSRDAIILAVDIGLVVLCILHIPSVRQRATAPFIPARADAVTFVHEITDRAECGGLLEGDRILTWNGVAVTIPAITEFLGDQGRIGDLVNIEVDRAGVLMLVPVRLVPAHPPLYTVMISLIGFFTWCLGVFVLLAKRGDRTAAVLHWCMMAMAVVVVIAFEGVTPDSLLGFGSSILFFLSYTGLAATFFLFTTMFPTPKPRGFRLTVLLTYLPLLLLLTVMVYHHYRAVTLHSVEEFIIYRPLFDWFHALLIVYVGAGIASVIHSSLTAGSSEERRKIRWVLWGLSLGPTPFLLLTILPQVLQIPEMAPEAYTLPFLVIIPIAFSISFLKHRLLDIDLVISRTAAYAIVIGVVVVLYTAVVSGIAAIVGSQTGNVSVASAVVVALLFEPVRKRVQNLVDRRFFRIRYNYREAERKFQEKIRTAIDLPELAGGVLAQTEELIPVERSGFFILEQRGNRLTPLAQSNFGITPGHSVRFQIDHRSSDLHFPVSLNNHLEPGVPHASADAEVFHRWGMAIVFPFLSEQRTVLGFLALGPKKAGTRFTTDDVDLLTAVSGQVGLAIERIRLRRSLAMELAEKERLADLNALKSDFVSNVSHELKTPLTAIKMFAELLRSPSRKPNRQAEEYLGIIEGEADRLDRMVGTILDSARIDRGLKEYNFSETDLVAVTRHVVRIMGYQLTTQGFRVDVRTGTRPIVVQADHDAVAQAMINLVSNVIKYSADRKHITISLFRKNAHALCRVRDRGIGIPPEALPHLFERFYRVQAMAERAKGVGLGLPLVKHIMDAHGGSVSVESTPGRGSTFTLAFPLIRREKGGG